MSRLLPDRVLALFPAPVAGTARMVEAGLRDIASAADPTSLVRAKRASDPFDARDPEYIRDTLPAIRAWSELYFRGEVRDLANIPGGPVLLVGNHSGGTLIADTFVFSEAFYRHFGPERVYHQLAHDLVFSTPGARALLSRYGTVPANPGNMRRALERNAALLVYPGGDHETFRPSWESAQIDFAGRTGFVKLALELAVPIVPVVAIGGQETALFLGQGSGLAKRLGLDRALRLKVLPAQIAPPLGFTVLDLPLRFPLPAKITVQVLEPIDLRAKLGARASAEKGYDVVTKAMQAALTKLSDERLLPVVG
ncbi:MAG: acyltransferase family protein [Actinomycetota bacterium]|nr:acyltransferase family protein [Actinomycetota bacterium]